MKTWLKGVALIVIGVGVFAAIRTARLTSSQPIPLAHDKSVAIDVDVNAAVSRLSRAVQFETVTEDGGHDAPPDTFEQFHAFLADAFPRTHERLTHELIGQSLLFTWTGRNASLAPIIFAAHQDVVPATRDGWTFPPFAGTISGGAVWGRGTLDDKVGVLGLLEAVEGLIAAGVSPSRTIYFAFGHNEEAGAGSSGAGAVAAILVGRGVQNAVVLDEGGWIYDKIPGVAPHVALIGIAEKGFLSLELSVRTEGGHSSMPPRDTAIGILSKAVEQVEAHPMPPHLDGASAGLFDTLAPEMSMPMRALFANRWLTQPLIIRQLAQQAATNATIRTTTAATIFRAGDKENVLAPLATAVINFRLLPGDSIDDVITHVKGVVNDARVAIAPFNGEPGVTASPVSRPNTPEFRALGSAIRSVFPDVLVAPYLTLGATDARHYQHIAPQVFRFVPIDQPGSTDLLHAPNEHIMIDNYRNAIRAYAAIIQALGQFEK